MRFKRRFGLTPGKFPEQGRILSALFLLGAGLSVQIAAEASGFFLEGKLLRVFDGKFRQTPREIGKDLIKVITRIPPDTARGVYRKRPAFASLARDIHRLLESPAA